jgi:hypothetical protein
MKIYKSSLLFFLLAIQSYPAFAQNEGSDSDKKLLQLYNLQDYYLSQLKKAYISDTLKYGYKQHLTGVENEIALKHEEKIAGFKTFPNTEQLVQEETGRQEYRAIELEMMHESEPIVYANEINSFIFYGGIGLGALSYSLPLSMGIEKIFSEKLSAGFLLQNFSENIILKEQDDSLTSYTIYSSQYRYTYTSFNAKISCHFKIPSLNFEHFDLYSSALFGYNLSIGPNTIIEPETYSDAGKKGINFGLMGGIKYMADQTIGFYSEFGYSRNCYFSLGAVYRIVPPAVKKEKEKIEISDEVIEEENDVDLDENQNELENEGESETEKGEEEGVKEQKKKKEKSKDKKTSDRKDESNEEINEGDMDRNQPENEK